MSSLTLLLFSAITFAFYAIYVKHSGKGTTLQVFSFKDIPSCNAIKSKFSHQISCAALVALADKMDRDTSWQFEQPVDCMIGYGLENCVRKGDEYIVKQKGYLMVDGDTLHVMPLYFSVPAQSYVTPNGYPVALSGTEMSAQNENSFYSLSKKKGLLTEGCRRTFDEDGFAEFTCDSRLNLIKRKLHIGIINEDMDYRRS